jgi:3-dehydro-L-gulonate 2-dehydrogenase
MISIQFNELQQLLKQILLDHKFSEADAQMCAGIFSENTLVGVSSHGINRFPQFISLVKSGYIIPDAKPTVENSFNALEQWDGNLGPGPINALAITDRAIKLSEEYGIGCIGLRNTNHWMRAGYYGWHAAEKGYILICWTNTIPIMPPWGASKPRTGNNPVVFAFPRAEGHIVLDMALAQFSYGKLANYARTNEELPFAGGYDKAGNLTTNPKLILDSMRPLPIGYWKGSALSLLLDLIATILSGGKSTFDLGKQTEEYAVSQVFCAINPRKFNSPKLINQIVNEILENYLGSENNGDESVLYPGARILMNRKEYLKNGIPIDEKVWKKVQALKGKR